jgi:ABC-type nitrate/sulfonate/bicarbonate transport system permease component
VTQTTPRKVDSGSIASQPRIREAGWTWQRFWTRYRFSIITIINLTVFFILWELFARSGRVNALIFPTFTDVLNSLKIGWLGGGNLEGFNNRMLADYVIVQNFWETLRIYTISMLIAIGFGIPIGLLMGGSKWIDALMSPYIWTLSSLPRIAIYPILLMFLGIGESVKYAIIISTAIFPVIINTWAGVKTTEQSLINAAKVFGASKGQVYRKVVLPYTLPFVVSGVQQSLSRGLVGVVLAEFLSGATKMGGIGWLVFRSASAFNAPLTYAALLTLAVFALIMVQGTRSMEARIAPWRQVTKT